MTTEKLSPVNCAHGAPMGRHSYMADNPFTVKFRLHIVRLDRGGYDSGGAYWGNRPHGQSLYRAWTPCAEQFIDATSRENAKAKIIEDWEHATFYR